MANERLADSRLKGLKLTLSCLLFGLLAIPAAGQRKTAKSHKAKPAAARKSAPSSGAMRTEAQRDPFKIPPIMSGTGAGLGITGPLPPGKRGLVIGAMRLEGLVREDKTNTMIAVVANQTNRAYFLREHDELYNGVVSKITSDSVYFAENYLDNVGKVQTREVALKLGGASGEGR
jgi:hypothetical protein